MREILFRGKRIDNGEFVTGSFCMDALEQFNGLCGVDGFIRLYDKDSGKMQMYEVDRETVGQFTGLIDKNGKKIFEGDIVRYSEMLLLGEEYEHKDPVLYLEGGFTVGVYFLNHWLRDIADGNVQLEGIELIGNIHDIPVLLKKVDTNG